MSLPHCGHRTFAGANPLEMTFFAYEMTFFAFEMTFFAFEMMFFAFEMTFLPALGLPIFDFQFPRISPIPEDSPSAVRTDPHYKLWQAGQAQPLHLTVP
jgi:hypothetical protein